jgi:hypothetical protein
MKKKITVDAQVKTNETDGCGGDALPGTSRFFLNGRGIVKTNG